MDTNTKQPIKFSYKKKKKKLPAPIGDPAIAVMAVPIATKNIYAQESLSNINESKLPETRE